MINEIDRFVNWVHSSNPKTHIWQDHYCDLQQFGALVGGQSGDVFSSRATASGQDDDGYPVGDGSEVSIHIVQAPYYTIFFPSNRGFR